MPSAKRIFYFNRDKHHQKWTKAQLNRNNFF